MTEPFRVCIESCLPGYELKSSRADPNVMECKCVGSQEDPFSVIDCHEEQETIHLRVSLLFQSYNNDNFHAIMNYIAL